MALDQIKANKLPKDLVNGFDNTVKFNEKTVYEIQRDNYKSEEENAKINPNSAIMCYFQDSEVSNFKKAVLRVLF